MLGLCLRDSHGRDFSIRLRCIRDIRHLRDSHGLLASARTSGRGLKALTETARAGVVARSHVVNTSVRVVVDVAEERRARLMMLEKTRSPNQHDRGR